MNWHKRYILVWEGESVWIRWKHQEMYTWLSGIFSDHAYMYGTSTHWIEFCCNITYNCVIPSVFMMKHVLHVQHHIHLTLKFANFHNCGKKERNKGTVTKHTNVRHENIITHVTPITIISRIFNIDNVSGYPVEWFECHEIVWHVDTKSTKPRGKWQWCAAICTS